MKKAQNSVAKKAETNAVANTVNNRLEMFQAA